MSHENRDSTAVFASPSSTSLGLIFTGKTHLIDHQRAGIHDRRCMATKSGRNDVGRAGKVVRKIYFVMYSSENNYYCSCWFFFFLFAWISSSVTGMATPWFFNVHVSSATLTCSRLSDSLPILSRSCCLKTPSSPWFDTSRAKM